MCSSFAPGCVKLAAFPYGDEQMTFGEKIKKKLIRLGEHTFQKLNHTPSLLLPCKRLTSVDGAASADQDAKEEVRDEYFYFVDGGNVNKL